ncbi:hypothetical protein [Vallitalea okinawensis]|uniref:hypothetical protein n=1 Tax=Vallitalea okinawensis TaxID=2078660 RepID=UPI000CFC3B8F|nr:hypothetical protein [Vallitalea okinawensis]
MKIAVISPGRRQGATTVSVLLGVALAQTQNLRVCLTHTGTYSESINTFLGLKEIQDKTRSLTQVIKLLEANAISGEEISDYCIKLGANLDIINTASHALSQADSDRLLSFVLQNLKHDVVITDVTTEFYEETTQGVIDSSDLVIMVLTQAKDILKKFELWRQSNYYKKLQDKGLIFIVNQYDPYVGAFRDMTKHLGLKHRRCCKIAYSPFIKRTGNQGKLHTILPYIMDKDVRVIELHNDIKECLHVITANLGMPMDWRR